MFAQALSPLSNSASHNWLLQWGCLSMRTELGPVKWSQLAMVWLAMAPT